MSETVQSMDNSPATDRHIKIIIWVSCLVSIVISIWSYYADPIINNDGIDYVRAAAAIVEGDFAGSANHYKWLFYPVLMALIHLLTGVSYYIAAVLINALANVIAVSYFILILRLLSTSTSVLIIGAIVIVTFPGLNEVRSFLIRDHGYIAFYLMSFYYFGQYWLGKSQHTASTGLFSKPKIKTHYALSLISALVAFLFRIEGLVFLMIILMIPIFYRLRTHQYFKLIALSSITLSLLFVICVYGIWLYTPMPDANYAKLSLQAVITGWQQISQQLGSQIDVMKDEIIQTSSGNIGRYVYFWLAVGLVISHVVALLTLLYTLFFIYGWRHVTHFFHHKLYKVWFVFVVANVAILMLFSLTQLFLTDRYPLPLTITLLLFVVFALNHGLMRWRNNQSNNAKKWPNGWVYFIFLLLFVNAFQGLTSVTKKKEMVGVGESFKQLMSPDYRIYRRDNVLFTNSKLLGYYSGVNSESIRVYENEKQMWQFFYLGKWVDYQYVILDIVPTAERENHFKTAFWANPTLIIKGRKGREYRFYDIQQYRKERKAGKIR